MSVRFTQSCPTCGRRIEVRTSLMGCDVRCQHCDAVFVAQDGDTYQNGTQSGARHSQAELQARDEFAADPLMDRVEQALNRAEESAAIG